MNIALIGYGYWGPNIAKNIHNSHMCNLFAICDKKPERLAVARKTYVEETTYTMDYMELLKNPEIDAIALAVETESHYAIGKEVLHADKHLFVEKPFTQSSKEAVGLSQIANERNLIIHVDHIMVYHPIIKKIKELIDSKEIGSIIYFDISRMNLGKIKEDVSSMWDLAVHDLAIIDYLGDKEEPIYIEAIGERRFSKKETLTYLTLKYSDFLAHIKSSWISPIKERRIIIAGDKKMAVFDDMKLVEKLTIYNSGIDISFRSGIKEYGDYVIKVRTGDILIPFIPEEDALRNSIEHFVECSKSGQQSLSGPDQAIRVIKILEGADERLDNVLV